MMAGGRAATSSTDVRSIARRWPTTSCRERARAQTRRASWKTRLLLFYTCLKNPRFYNAAAEGRRRSPSIMCARTRARHIATTSRRLSQCNSSPTISEYVCAQPLSLSHAASSCKQMTREHRSLWFRVLLFDKRKRRKALSAVVVAVPTGSIIY